MASSCSRGLSYQPLFKRPIQQVPIFLKTRRKQKSTTYRLYAALLVLRPLAFAFRFAWACFILIRVAAVMGARTPDINAFSTFLLTVGLCMTLSRRRM
jgi:hypothetical protein